MQPDRNKTAASINTFVMMGPSSPDDLKDIQLSIQTLNRLCRDRSPPVQRLARPTLRHRRRPIILPAGAAAAERGRIRRPVGVGERNPVERSHRYIGELAAISPMLGSPGVG